MRAVLDYDPLKGLTTWFNYDAHTEQMTITYEQDVSRFVDFAHKLAVMPEYTAHGIKNDMWHYARVPEVVQYEMLFKHGVDIGKPEHRKKFFELLNTEYKKCKTTEKMHYEPR